MDRDVATIVTTAVTYSISHLAELVPFLKENCEPETYRTFLDAISRAIYETGLVRECAFDRFPDIKEEMEARLNKYGRLC